MTIEITDRIGSDMREDIQSAIEPLLIENGVDTDVVVLKSLSINRYGQVEMKLKQRSESE